MQFIIHGLAFLGGAGVFVLLIIGVSMVITELLEHRRSAITRYETYRFKQYIRIVAQQFSEDPPTLGLLLGLAEEKSAEELRKNWLKAREEQTPSVPPPPPPLIMQAPAPAPVPPAKAGEWVFDEPHFVDSEDCMGNPQKYWRVWAHRQNASPHRESACGTGRTPAEAVSACRKRTRTKAEVLYARSKPGSGCCDTYCDNMSCNCLEKAADA